MAGVDPGWGSADEEGGEPRRPPRRDPRLVGAGVAVGKVVLLPARIVLRIVPVERRARVLAGQARGAATRVTTSAVEDVLASAEAQRVIDRALAGPLPESVAHSIVERQVAERMARAAAAGSDGTWPADDVDRLLATPEFQRAFDSALEHALSSPAVRTALTHQTTTLAGELAASIRHRAEIADAAVERPVRRALGRRRLTEIAGLPRFGGFVSRGVALAVDAVLVVILYAAAVTAARAIGAV